MNYLILTQHSPTYADNLSAGMMEIGRPKSVRNSYDKTKFYTTRHEHTDGRVALFIPDETKLVHPDANFDNLLSLIGESVTEDEINAIGAVLEGRRGSRVSLLAIIQASPSLSPNLKTQEQMEADGWFPQPEEL